MDRIYLNPDNEKIYFLDCTRLDGSKKIVSRRNYNNESVIKQIVLLSKKFKDQGVSKIVLADDVVFSGNVLKTVIRIFEKCGINVIGIRSGIATFESTMYFSESLPLGLKSKFILGENVIDQICERDFYFGLVGSGILIKNAEGKICKAPYFLPFGNPYERASIPKEDEIEFSKGCLQRSIDLWKEVELLSGRKIKIDELPERINNTSGDDIITEKLSLERSKLR